MTGIDPGNPVRAAVRSHMPVTVSATKYETPFGPGWVAFDGPEVVELGLPGSDPTRRIDRSVPAPVATLARQLTEYWNGGPLPPVSNELIDAVSSTRLTRDIYRIVAAIPAGMTNTYGAVAASAGRPRAARAVGAAMAANRLAPLIPCHRLVGSDGSLRGYAGGLEMKRYLLAIERATADG